MKKLLEQKKTTTNDSRRNGNLIWLITSEEMELSDEKPPQKKSPGFTGEHHQTM